MTPPATDPKARQLGILAGAFQRIESRRTLVAQVAGVTAVFLIAGVAAARRPGGPETLAWLVFAVGAYLVLGIGLVELLRPARVRSAFETFLWIGGRQYRDALAVTGLARLPTSPDKMRRWLSKTAPRPDLATIRIEGLTWTGQFEAARELVESLPEDRPVERFEKELNRAFVRFVATGDGTLSEAKAAAADLRGDERIRADALLATEGARQRVAANDPDWIAPLVEVRPRIGRDADRLILRDLVPKMFRGYLLVGVLFALVVFAVNGVVAVQFP